jgi:hypothetical protein
MYYPGQRVRLTSSYHCGEPNCPEHESAVEGVVEAASATQLLIEIGPQQILYVNEGCYTNQVQLTGKGAAGWVETHGHEPVEIEAWQ